MTLNVIEVRVLNNDYIFEKKKKTYVYRRINDTVALEILVMQCWYTRDKYIWHLLLHH